MMLYFDVTARHHEQFAAFAADFRRRCRLLFIFLCHYRPLMPPLRRYAWPPRHYADYALPLLNSQCSFFVATIS